MRRRQDTVADDVVVILERSSSDGSESSSRGSDACNSSFSARTRGVSVTPTRPATRLEPRAARRALRARSAELRMRSPGRRDRQGGRPPRGASEPLEGLPNRTTVQGTGGLLALDLLQQLGPTGRHAATLLLDRPRQSLSRPEPGPHARPPPHSPDAETPPAPAMIYNNLSSMHSLTTRPRRDAAVREASTPRTSRE